MDDQEDVQEEETPVEIEEVHIHANSNGQEQAPTSHSHEEYAQLAAAINELDARCRNIEGELATLRSAISAKREHGPIEDHFWSRPVGRRE